MRPRLIGTILFRDSGRAYEVWDTQRGRPEGDEATLADIRRRLEAGPVAAIPANYRVFPAGQAPQSWYAAG